MKMVVSTMDRLEAASDSSGIVRLDTDLIINKGHLHDFYKVDPGEPFATGLYAQVKRCRNVRGGPAGPFAAKFSPRRRPGGSSDEDCVESLHEIALLSQLRHPYIIAFKDAFLLEESIVTVMEFAPGGDLQSIIDADLVLLEKDASRYVFQLLEALKYLHSRNIAHLDIKPQNLLLMGEFPACNVKLCDFEISRVVAPGMEVREILGTPDYVAPEVLQYEPLSTAADLWSVGILTYVLLTGFSPFGGDTDQETFANILNEPIDFPSELFEDVSPQAVEFIGDLVVKQVKLRPTAVSIQSHPWVQSHVESGPPPPPPPKPPNLQVPMDDCGASPKKRSPRKTIAASGATMASAAARRSTARAILRACKSAYDLNKMGGMTKSREALIEKMKIADVTSGSWRLRKNLSKSREQLWESKIQLSKSCEKINNNLPGSGRWASVANFPSLDLNAVKLSTSQESVASVFSTCTNTDHRLLDVDFDCFLPMNGSPRILQKYEEPLSIGSPPSIITCDTYYQPDISSPSTPNGIINGGPLSIHPLSPSNSSYSLDEQEETQKSVAELIMTFGGRGNSGSFSKKLDLKPKFEPIFEVDGKEEEPASLGEASDNNSNSSASLRDIQLKSVPVISAILDSQKKSSVVPNPVTRPTFLVGSEVRSDRFSQQSEPNNNNDTNNGNGMVRKLSAPDSPSSQSLSPSPTSMSMSISKMSLTDIQRSVPIDNLPTTPTSPVTNNHSQLKSILKPRPEEKEVLQSQTTLPTMTLNPPIYTGRRGSIPGNLALISKPTISSILKQHDPNTRGNGTGPGQMQRLSVADAIGAKISPQGPKSPRGQAPKDPWNTEPYPGSKYENTFTSTATHTRHPRNSKSPRRSSTSSTGKVQSPKFKTEMTLETSTAPRSPAGTTQTSFSDTSIPSSPVTPTATKGTNTILTKIMECDPDSCPPELPHPNEVKLNKLLNSNNNHSNNNKSKSTPIKSKDQVVQVQACEATMGAKDDKSSGMEKDKKLIKGEKPHWGFICTGSVGRARTRFESGTMVKLRRGSVPDF